MNPLVSIIIPTKNSSQFLELCLQSIQNQTYQPLELIVVDNFSSDGTPEIARRYTHRFFQKGPERSAQRNFGVQKSSGEYVLIVDSDMVLDSRVVAECMDVIQNQSEVKAVVIPEISMGEGFWAKCKALERSCYVGDETIEAARFFEKKLFLTLGGYDEAIHGGGEDWDLPDRIRDAGHKIDRISAYIQHMEGTLSLFETMKTKCYYGKTFGIYIKKQPVHAKNKIKIIRPAFLRHRKKLIQHPLIASGLLLMKFCEFVAGGIGFLISKLSKKLYL